MTWMVRRLGRTINPISRGTKYHVDYADSWILAIDNYQGEESDVCLRLKI